MVLLACVPLLGAASIVVVPSGMGGVRVSQIRGTLPGTLYPGVHFITPMSESVEIFDLRDHLFTAGFAEEGAKSAAHGLSVQSLEGLNIGLAVTVRYRLDPNKLDSRMLQPVDKELVPPVAAPPFPLAVVPPVPLAPPVPTVPPAPVVPPVPGWPPLLEAVLPPLPTPIPVLDDEQPIEPTVRNPTAM